MTDLFTEQEIDNLTKNHNWELVNDGNQYLLRQKDHHYMKTRSFDLPKEIADKYLHAG